jgi:hypothetical protein
VACFQSMARRSCLYSHNAFVAEYIDTETGFVRIADIADACLTLSNSDLLVASGW